MKKCLDCGDPVEYRMGFYRCNNHGCQFFSMNRLEDGRVQVRHLDQNPWSEPYDIPKGWLWCGKKFTIN